MRINSREGSLTKRIQKKLLFVDITENIRKNNLNHIVYVKFDLQIISEEGRGSWDFYCGNLRVRVTQDIEIPVNKEENHEEITKEVAGKKAG